MLTADESADLVEEYGTGTVVAALSPVMTDERRERIDQVLDARLGSLTVVLENLYDPHNGAAALRSAEGLGLDTVHVVEAAGPFDAASTITIGCERWMTVITHRDTPSAAAQLKDQGMVLCAAVPNAGKTLEDVPADQALALWFGNEREGLTREAIDLCDHKIEIPMYGFTRSFNLSVSVALLTDLAARRRRAALGAVGDLDARERAIRRARWYAQDVRGAKEIVSRFAAQHVSERPHS